MLPAHMTHVTKSNPTLLSARFIGTHNGKAYIPDIRYDTEHLCYIMYKWCLIILGSNIFRNVFASLEMHK